MKAGEQLSAMEMMAVDPLSRVIAPRLWAGIICDADFGNHLYGCWCDGRLL